MKQNLSDVSDSVLVKMTIDGNKSAYEELVIRHEKAVFSAVSAFLAGTLREDAVQNAFVTAWLKLDTLREPEKFKSWVCKIAKNCAKNMAARTDEYLPLDSNTISEYESGHPQTSDTPFFDDNTDLLHEKLEILPNKIKRAILLHYIEGYSISEISNATSTPAGTVKWMLHEGRRLLRKELGKMDKNEKRTIAAQVMDRINQLELWCLCDDKTGYSEKFTDILTEVESLPESDEKESFIALMMQQKQWFIDSDHDNPETYERMRDAALKSHNDRVMMTVASIEHEKFKGEEKIAFMRDEQIPKFEKEGFRLALGYTWFWLGVEYCGIKAYDEALDAFEKVLNIMPCSEVYHSNAKSAIKNVLLIRDKLSKIEGATYEISFIADRFLIIDGNMRLKDEPGSTEGSDEELIIYMNNPIEMIFAFPNVCNIDRYFLKTDINPGDSYVSSKGARLTRNPEKYTIITPCGKFENCELWVEERGDSTPSGSGMFSDKYENYFCPGVGLVKQVIYDGPYSSTLLLENYKIAGDSILPDHPLPVCAGNLWLYRREKPIDGDRYFECDISVEMTYADERSVICSSCAATVKYPDNYTGKRENNFGDF